MMQPAGLVVAGLSGGSGKSVVAVGLIAALRQANCMVVPFKKGPDYIDAAWLARAAAHPCYNLDPYLMSERDIVVSYITHAAAGECAVIEGNRGLYDGVTAGGRFSTAELAIQLDLPVLLVINCSKTTRTVAAMVLGCRLLDERVRIRGVILNHIATSRHEQVVRQAVEEYGGVEVLGIVPRACERYLAHDVHLGVTPCSGKYAAEGWSTQRCALEKTSGFGPLGPQRQRDTILRGPVASNTGRDPREKPLRRVSHPHGGRPPDGRKKRGGRQHTSPTNRGGPSATGDPSTEGATTTPRKTRRLCSNKGGNTTLSETDWYAE